MKKLLITLALSLVFTNANANANAVINEDDKQHCFFLGSIARVAMLYRQTNRSLEQYMVAADTEEGIDMEIWQDVWFELGRLAYKSDKVYGKESRDHEISNFQDTVVTGCLDYKEQKNVN